MPRGDLSSALPSFFDELSKIAEIAYNQARRGTPVTKSFSNLRENLRRGDVLVSKPGGKTDAISVVANAYDTLTGSKHKGWSHVAMYLGDGNVGHLSAKKTFRGKVLGVPPAIRKDKLLLFDRSGQDVLVLRHRSADKAADAADRMDGMVRREREIGYGKYLVSLARAGFDVPGKDVGDAVCSSFVGSAFGDRDISKRSPLSFRPKDFLESRKLRHVFAYEKGRAPNGK